MSSQATAIQQYVSCFRRVPVIVSRTPDQFGRTGSILADGNMKNVRLQNVFDNPTSDSVVHKRIPDRGQRSLSQRSTIPRRATLRRSRHDHRTKFRTKRDKKMKSGRRKRRRSGEKQVKINDTKEEWVTDAVTGRLTTTRNKKRILA